MNMRSVVAYIARRQNQVRKGGWPVLRRKANVVFRKIVFFPIFLFELPFAALAVLVLRLIQPICIIRFGGIHSSRIGAFAAYPELYLCKRDAAMNLPKKKFMDIFFYLDPPCNKQLDVMWRRVLNIGPRMLLHPVVSINSLIPGGNRHQITDDIRTDRDIHNLLDMTSPHLKFLPDEELSGQAGLHALGIPPGVQFVCLIVRDSSYLKKYMPWRSWDYHNYRDCSIQNYVYAARELANRGYYVVRMGAIVKEPINAMHPMIIDYATSGARSDFMDIYLGAKCAFCISNSTGYDAVPYIFRRPIVFVDHVPIGLFTTFSNRFLATTKKHWWRNNKRFMTFREIFESGAAYFSFANQFEERGIELIESTPEEIAAVVLEMESRLKGTWVGTDQDEVLQRRFWELFPKSKFHGEIKSRVGAEFLRKNREWLN